MAGCLCFFVLNYQIRTCHYIEIRLDILKRTFYNKVNGTNVQMEGL